MNKDKHIGIMTYHTLRYLHRDRFIQNEFYASKTVADIKNVIWKRVKPHMVTAEDEEGFKKGAALCDFPAILEWLQNEQSKSLPVKDYKSTGGGTATDQAMEMVGGSKSIPEQEQIRE